MKSDYSIPPESWMLDPRCRKIMDTLNQNSDVPMALFVGGCVRDLLVHRQTSDLDIATKYRPDDVKRLCESAGFKVFPTGIDHGTLTIIINHQVFEVTTLRRDVETDGRRATIAYADKWEEDAARRDFTMNTLLIDLTGNVYDPTGRGLDDLKKGQIIFVGDPVQRIKEDYLRILRFFRFHTNFGKGVADRAALEACKAQSDNIPKLSKERITQEIFKIAIMENSPNTFKLMFNNSVLEDFLCSKDDFFDVLIQRQSRYDLIYLPARLYYLMGADLSLIEQASQKYFVFTNAQKQYFRQFDHLLKQKHLTQNIKELYYRYDLQLAEQIVLASYDDNQIPQILEELHHWVLPVFPLNGHDAKKLGIPQNHMMGELLTKTEEWWISQDFKPQKQDLREYLKNLLG